MRISHVELNSWKNFRKVEVDLPDRVFLVGPNASGKSNFLDALRFLRDLAAPGGGLQRAVLERGGVSKIRCLAARQDPVGIKVHLAEGNRTEWRYEIKFRQQTRGNRLPVLIKEAVWHKNKLILERPNSDDLADEPRLTQTALEQINLNVAFREMTQFFERIAYLHLVPQLIRSRGDLGGNLGVSSEVYGNNFLERLAKTNDKTLNARLRRIREALTIAVPQLKELSLKRDERGVPHLIGDYEHWRPRAAKQNEEQFSDGTLRLIGLLWSLQEGEGPLLLEEPELSLHSSIVRRLPGLIHRIQRARNRQVRQVLISTHSVELLNNPEIGGEEILMLLPSQEGTQVKVAATVPEIRQLMEAGMSAAEAVIPHTEPEDIHQLELFKL